MASIAATAVDYAKDKQKIWTPITEADTPVKTPVFGGRYTLSVEGAFGTGSIEWKFAHLDATTPYSIDATNLTFTANGSYNVEVGAGYLIPVRTGGSSMSVTAVATPIP